MMRRGALPGEVIALMVQFRVVRLFGLQVTVEGMLLANARGLQLVFKQPAGEVVSREVPTQSVELPWAALESIQFDYGLMSDQVMLHVKSATSLASFPGATEREAALSVYKQQREELKELEQRIGEYRRGTRRDDVDDLLDDVRDFLQGN